MPLPTHFLEALRTFWVPLIVYFALLGVLLISLGITLAGWITALMDRERKRAEMQQ